MRKAKVSVGSFSHPSSTMLCRAVKAGKPAKSGAKRVLRAASTPKPSGVPSYMRATKSASHRRVRKTNKQKRLQSSAVTSDGKSKPFRPTKPVAFSLASEKRVLAAKKRREATRSEPRLTRTSAEIAEIAKAMKLKKMEKARQAI